MNPKTTIGLVLALAIAVVGVWWARSSESREKKETQTPGPKALLEPPLGELAAFEIKTGSEPAIEFVMQDGKWRMAAPVDWPGEHYKVQADAGQIKNIQYVKSYSGNDPDRPTAEMTSLDNPLKIIKLTDTAGKSYVVKIGARQALSAKTYVQREGDDTVYLVDSDLSKQTHKGPSDYRERRVAVFDQADAVRIDVSGEKRYTLVKHDGKWTIDSPVKGRVDTPKVQSVLRALSGMRATVFVDDTPKSLRPYGLEKPRLTVAVTTEKKTPKPPPPPPASAPAEPDFDVKIETVGLALGGEADDEVFARINDESRPTVFKVTSASVKQATPPLDDLRDKRVAAMHMGRPQKIVASSGGETVELVRKNGGWEIAPASAVVQPAPAELAAVDDLLKALRDLKAVGFEPDELPTHGFDTPRANISVSLEGQVEPIVLSLGNPTPSKTGAYVRNEREGFIAVVKKDAADALIVQPTSFASRELVKFSRSWASKLTVQRQDRRMEVVRDGSAWRFVSPVEGKAETDVVNTILSDLAHLRGRRVVGGPQDIATFGLDSPEVTVTVTVESPPKQKKVPTTQTATAPAPEEDDSEKEPPKLYTVLLVRGGGKVYAMVEGGTTICELDAKVLEDLKAELFDTRVTSLEPDKAVRLTYTGQAEFEFEKDGERWTLSGEPTFQTDTAKIKDVLDALRDLRAIRYVRYSGANPDEYGLYEPQLTVGVETSTGEWKTLLISSRGPDEGGRYAAGCTALDRVFVISQENVDRFLKQVQDFQE